MARPRKPTAVLELTGAFEKDPQRKAARSGEPRPEGALGNPPECFDAVHIELWNEIQAEVPARVLTSADRTLVEIVCRLKLKLRTGKIHGGELSVLASCLTRMGLTPADRSRISIPKQEEDPNADPLDALEGKLRRIK